MITGLDANVNGQALYVPGVPVGGQVHNDLYAYTSNNRDHSAGGLNAFDADTGGGCDGDDPGDPGIGGADERPD